MSRCIGTNFRTIRCFPIEQSPFVPADNQVLDTRLAYQLRHLQGTSRYIHVKVRRGLIPIEIFLQPFSPQIELAS